MRRERTGACSARIALLARSGCKKCSARAKSAVQELTVRNGRRITAATCRIRPNTCTQAQAQAGLKGNYRGPQTCGQPLRDAVGLVSGSQTQHWTHQEIRLLGETQQQTESERAKNTHTLISCSAGCCCF